ncbi:MAG: phosphoadenylyl-sulfate reductase [Promethearchaeota archaeon]
MRFTITEKIETVRRLKQIFIDMDADNIVKLAYEEFKDQMAVTTAFGYSGIILLSIIKKYAPEIEIFFIDTRFHFEETLKLRDKLLKEWKLNIKTIQPSFTESELENLIGKEPYKTNPDICCHYRKVEPLLRILRSKQVWLSAIRRDQSITRAEIESIEIDQRGVIKINPLYKWTRDDAWMYIRKYNLPYNLLHDQYYYSIGCKPCTSPVDEGGDERDGRWKDFMKLECGIHLYEKKDAKTSLNSNKR